MEVGSVITVSHIPYREPRKKGQPGIISATYRPKNKNNNFVLIYIGEEPKDGSSPLDIKSAVKQMRWTPINPTP